MSKQPYYCANCGQRLTVNLKAMPKYGTVVRLVSYHECGEVQEFDLKENPAPTYDGKNEFAQNLDKLQPSPSSDAVDTEALRDRRTDPDIKSTAPDNLLDHLKRQRNV